MNISRALSISIATLAASLALQACSSISFDSNLFLDEAWIAREGDSYSYINHSQTAGTTEAEMRFRGFYGKHSVWAFTAPGPAELVLQIEVAPGLDGRYKVCFVGVDGQVLTLEDAAGSSSHTLELVHGRQYLVVVGDAAYGSVTLRLKEGPEPRNYEIGVLL